MNNPIFIAVIKIYLKRFFQRLRLEEIERKLKEKEEEISPEERIRREKESDLVLALETTFGFDGDTTKEEGGTIDSMNPTTKEEFTEFAEVLNKKLITLAKSPEFPAFAEDHIRNLCATRKFSKTMFLLQ